jgi:hypothetical protein
VQSKFYDAVVLLQAIFGISVHAYSELKYNRVYTYPQWAIVLGWVMASSSIVMIPTVAVIMTLRGKGSLTEVRLDFYSCTCSPVNVHKKPHETCSSQYCEHSPLEWPSSFV